MASFVILERYILKHQTVSRKNSFGSRNNLTVNVKAYRSLTVVTDISDHLLKWKREIYISVNTQRSRRKYVNIPNKSVPQTANCNHQKHRGRGVRGEILKPTSWSCETAKLEFYYSGTLTPRPPVSPPPLERSHHTRRAFLILAVSAALLGCKRAPEMVQPEAVSGGEAWRAAGAIGISGPQQNSSAD